MSYLFFFYPREALDSPSVDTLATVKGEKSLREAATSSTIDLKELDSRLIALTLIHYNTSHYLFSPDRQRYPP